jgi:hypothetical protein
MKKDLPLSVTNFPFLLEDKTALTAGTFCIWLYDVNLCITSCIVFATIAALPYGKPNRYQLLCIKINIIH